MRDREVRNKPNAHSTEGGTMDEESIKALWDSYAAEDKNDFFPIYHYLKHIQRLMYFAMLQSGQAPIEPEKKPKRKEESSMGMPSTSNLR